MALRKGKQRSRPRGRPRKQEQERITQIPELALPLNTLIREKEQREDRTISLFEVSKVTGICRHTVSAISRGEWTGIRLKDVAALIAYFDCPVGEVVQIASAQTKDCPGVAP